jgi:hypothetical protein
VLHSTKFLSLTLFFVLIVTEKSIAVRLIGPSSSNGTGRVEVFYNGQWGTICHDYWNINIAKVVCRQVGFPYVARALYGYQVPDGTGKIWLDNVICTGNEQSLINCSHNGWGNHNCGHYQDAGVECSRGKMIISIPYKYNDNLNSGVAYFAL